MKLDDPLYGRIQIEDWIKPVLLSPEVQRLSQIRLLNCPSPSFAALGEVRRYSHTIGVLHLASLVDLAAFPEHLRRAFFVSVLLHDLGTPPFGHLLEYQLQEYFGAGWHHEKMPKAVLEATHAPEGAAHQFHAGRLLGLSRAVDACGVRIQHVIEICEGDHPLSSLLFGSLDLDNIDNVFRMALMLGLEFEREVPKRLAKQVRPGSKSELMLGKQAGKQLVDVWAALRRRVYELLNLSGEAVAYQSVLSHGIETLVQAGEVVEPSWTLTDDALFRTLSENPRTKERFIYQFYDQPPEVAFKFFVDIPFEEFGLRSRKQLNSKIEQSYLHALLGGAQANGGSTNLRPAARVSVYSIVDRGSFSKKLSFVDPVSLETWTHGVRSEGIIAYVFVPAGAKSMKIETSRFFETFSELVGLPVSRLVSSLRPFPEDNDVQPDLPGI